MTPPSSEQLLLVTGSPRSGTSSLAGSLNKLGWHVPEPVVQAAERNTKGHFEPVWSIKFHKRHLARAVMMPTDARPNSAELMHDVLEGSPALDQLVAWLDPMEQPRIVVKDPHAPLFVPLWREAAQRVGRDLTVLVIARHPAEVVGSRDRTWGQGRDDDRRKALETRNTAQWLNTLLVCESNSRGLRRSFIRYEDLLDDWRSALGRVSDQLGLGLDTAAEPHELDTWLDPGMKRVALTWPDLRCAAEVKDLAEQGWQQVERLLEDPADVDAITALQTVRATYTDLYDDALALVDDEIEQQRTAAHQEIKKLRGRIKGLREQLEAAPTTEPEPESESESPARRRPFHRG